MGRALRRPVVTLMAGGLASARPTCQMLPRLDVAGGPRGGRTMKAFLIAGAALVVIAVAAGFLLNTEFAVPASERYVAGDSVRLDDGQRSDARYPE